VREQPVGFEVGDEAQRGVGAELGPGGEEQRDHRVLDGVGGVGGVAERGDDAGGFRVAGGAEQRLLAREIPVQSGSRAAGLAGHVVEGGLADPLTGDTGQHRRDHPGLEDLRAARLLTLGGEDVHGHT